MDAPTVALRFRDTTPGIDTIDVHLDILRRCGSVWWGWWKKGFEEDHLDFFSEAGVSLNLAIIDRSTKRMFLAKAADRIIGTGAAPNRDLIPTYYQHSANEVFGWFKITSIEQVEYNAEIANQFGDNTAVIVDQKLERVEVRNESDSKHSEKSSILILSDLHFGPDYDYLKQGHVADLGCGKRTLTSCLVDDLKRIKLQDDIASVMVTGDFTSNGSWEDHDIKYLSDELLELTKVLGIDLGSLICIPGNHDVVRYPEGWQGDPAKLAVDNQVSFKHERDFRYFLNSLLGRDIKHPLDYIERIKLREVDVLVGALNSCRILATSWTEYGYVGQSGIEVISLLGEERVERPTFKVVAIHHHLLPVNQVEAPKKNGVTLSLDASKILEAAQASGVHIAIHGHQHMPHLARYQSIPMVGHKQTAALTVVSNGSAGVSAKRRPGEERNTYCVLTFSKDEVQLQMRELRSDGRPGNQLYDCSVGTMPAMPD